MEESELAMILGARRRVRSRAIVQGLILEGPIGCPLQILELAGAQGPEESEKADRAQKQGRRNEPGERRHDPLPLARRAALSVTRIEEVDMTIAAISGVT